tara:strand:+ start:144 stop:911 length:768 start_codon:yes stop_codon:yes gene_type:complete
MGSYFIYDSINQYRSDNVVSEGAMSDSATPTFTPASKITDHERASDENISTTISAIADLDALEYAVGSSATANAAAVYFTGDDGISSGTIMTFFIDTDRAALPSKGTISAVSGAGWATTDLTETTGTKFFTEFNASVANVSEVLIGKKLSFELEPDVNIQSSINYNNIENSSMGGIDYVVNINPGQEEITIGFQNISSTFKDALIEMQNSNKANAKKLLYFDGSNYHWVRLQTMKFTEIADGRWSTQIKMKQQIQ